LAPRVGDEFKGLRKLREALGARLIAGVAFSTGVHSCTYEDRLHVLSIDRPWRPALMEANPSATSRSSPLRLSPDQAMSQRMAFIADSRPPNAVACSSVLRLRSHRWVGQAMASRALLSPVDTASR